MAEPQRTCAFADDDFAMRCTECGVTLDLCLCAGVDNLASERLFSPDGKMITDILGEVRSAREKFPGSRHMLCALVEEVGELAQAIMQNDRHEGTTETEVYREAVQVAAMAIRIGTEGDEAFEYALPTLRE